MKVLTAFVIIIFTRVYGKSLLLMGEKVTDCTKDGAKFGNWSRVQFEYVNDTTYYLNGIFKVERKIKKPWKMHYYIERFDRGSWHMAIMDRVIPDFCKVMADPKAPWSVFVNHLRQKQCPFEEGYEQKFDMEYVKESILPEYYGLGMMGQYRVFCVSHFLEQDGNIFEECLKLTFDIVYL
ncbi:hypothetical protein PVAND_006072 [Polypedilum vanderplanki]|uniref:Uncharacterized protein n=1 Tax=Polypedilum vanderplanki TaxID=319348 RepID=A0A9J6C2G1_POLVA|nr:hypothetical protein PVAND_006072 [Polypedilum vanderplanki]